MNLTLNPPSRSVRQFAGWLLTCLMAMVLSACVGDGDDGPAAPAPAPTAPTITTPPAGAKVTAPAPATFTVTATGSDPLTYQWAKNGTVIAGATAASYTTPATVDADNGALFTVVVSNSAGSATSVAATLTVGPAIIAPTVVTPPAAQTVTAPATATFMATFNGTAPLSYQWTRNDVAIAGATATSYTTPATTVAADNGALYAVTATNAGGSKKTDAAKLTVNPMPTPVSIGTQPVAQSVTAPATATFTVTATGDAPISYQWLRNGTAIAGATAASYTTAATTAADSGAVFKVVVTNPVNTVTSADAPLTVTATPPVIAPVAIATQPADVNPVVGAAASFSVTATGTAPITYQWFRDTTAIAGATAATYTLASVAQTDNGAKFSVTVSNAVNSVPSRQATLSITPLPPVIATQPVDTAVVVGQTASFMVTVTGTSPFTYQWKKNGTAIAGATAASYTTPAAVQTDNGALFTVVVSNNAPAGTATSSAAKLTVSTPIAPVITVQPTSASAANATTTTFSVTATGTAPLAYQWSKNGTAIPGATGASYTTPIVSFADDQAKYTVVVSNPSTTTATSAAAVLTVTLPPTPVVQVSAGTSHSVALRSSGAMYSWSEWAQSQLVYNAPAGAGAFAFSPGAPVRARNVDNTPFLNVQSISAGTTHTALVRSDGTVWTSGYVGGNNGNCPIGDGACTTRFYPTQLKDASGVPFTGARQVAAAYYYSLAVKTDGSLWAWGQNQSGNLGDGSQTARLSPVQVTDPTAGGFFTGAIAVAASIDHAMALKADSTVYAWGYNDVGQIGDGSSSIAYGTAIPTRVEVAPGVLLTGITAIAAGERHSVALKSDGTVYAWGYNGNGALGDGTTTNRLRATVMRDTAGNPLTNVAAIAAGQNFTILLMKDGTVLATGQNDIGQLGDNSNAAYQINAVPVRDAAGAVFGSVAAISSYHEHTVVYRTDGTVWAWGLNDSRQLGDTTNVSRRNPVPAPAYVP